MNSLLIALIAIIFWVLGYFFYDLGTVSHVLLGIALATVGLNYFQGRKLRKKIHGKLF